MNETTITSRSNPWVQQWLRYQAKPAERKAAGVVWLEGEHLVVEALNRLASSHFSLTALVFSSTEAGNAMHQKLSSHGAAVSEANIVWLGDSAYKALSTMDSLPSVSAVLQLNTAMQQPDYTASAMVLDGVQDPGNIGTMIRLCAAFGVPQIFLSTGCASAWSSKALRAGQGAQLAVQVHEDVGLNAAYAAFKRCSMPVAATSLAAGSVALNQANLHQKMVWVFGNEGQGISLSSQAAATQFVHIPMQGGFESLNVATAAAICLWQWRQQHQQLQHQQLQQLQSHSS
jgi:RNA methyltransferase, TrmH family